jgi:hypothetical protein
VELNPNGHLVEQYRQAWAQADEKIDFLLFLRRVWTALNLISSLQELLSHGYYTAKWDW